MSFESKVTLLPPARCGDVMLESQHWEDEPEEISLG